MSNSTTEPLQAYALYPFQTDAAYQKGLETILAFSGDSSSSNEDVELRARVFYFNRITGCSITIEQARYAEATTSSPQTAVDIANGGEAVSNPGASEERPLSPQNRSFYELEPEVLTFAELQDLIASGRVDKIPNNKVIPDRLNDAPPSISTAPARRKPWECDTPEINEGNT